MRSLVTISILFVSSIIIMMHSSCDYGYIEPIVIDIPDTVSFSENIVPIFTGNCNESGCHTYGGIAPDLTPTNAYWELWMYGMIDTAQAESSPIYSRLSSTSNPMPPTGKLSEDKVQLVLAWIKQGAQDN